MPRLLVLTLLLALVPGGALRANPLVVGVERLSYLPYYSGAGERFEGFGRELLDRFAADTAREFEYRALPVRRLVHDFVAGSIDLKFPDNASWAPGEKRGAAVVYSVPIAGFIDGVSVPTDRVGRSALRTVALPRGFTLVHLQQEVDAGRLRLTEVTDLDQGIRMALANRVDGVYGNVLAVQWHLAHQMQQAGALLFDATLPHIADSYRVSSIRYPGLIRELDAWLEVHPAVVATLKAKWQIVL